MRMPGNNSWMTMGKYSQPLLLTPKKRGFRRHQGARQKGERRAPPRGGSLLDQLPGLQEEFLRGTPGVGGAWEERN